jgi:hypothetical protein
MCSKQMCHLSLRQDYNGLLNNFVLFSSFHTPRLNYFHELNKNSLHKFTRRLAEMGSIIIKLNIISLMAILYKKHYSMQRNQSYSKVFEKAFI